MTQAPKTVMLHSKTHTNLTIELEVNRPRASMSLRRRTSQHYISLPAHQTVDLCKHLEKTPDEVHAILIASPQVQRFGARGLLTWYDVMPAAPKAMSAGIDEAAQLRFVKDPREDDDGTDFLGELLNDGDD